MRGNEEIVRRAIGCIIRVHQTLGPGFLERVYKRALVIELRESGLSIETEKKITIWYGDRNVGHHRLDILVEGQLIIELKTVETLGKAHYAQVRSYLKAAKVRISLLVNFAKDRADFRRIAFPHSQPLPAFRPYTEGGAHD